MFRRKTAEKKAFLINLKRNRSKNRDYSISVFLCGMCESHINDVIRREFKVKKVSSSHTKGIAEIISENEIDEEKIKKAIADTGYDVTSFKSEPYERKKGIFSFLSK